MLTKQEKLALTSIALDQQFHNLPFKYQKQCVEQYIKTLQTLYNLPEKDLHTLVDKAMRCPMCNNKEHCVCK